jgi:hypothetical protein
MFMRIMDSDSEDGGVVELEDEEVLQFNEARLGKTRSDLNTW